VSVKPLLPSKLLKVFINIIGTFEVAIVVRQFVESEEDQTKNGLVNLVDFKFQFACLTEQIITFSLYVTERMGILRGYIVIEKPQHQKSEWKIEIRISALGAVSEHSVL